MTEHQALRLVSDLNGKSFDDMLSTAKDAGFDEMKVKLRFQSLYENGYVSGTFSLGLPVFITLEGSDRLDQLNQEAEDKAKQESQRRFQNQVSVAQVLVPLVTFLLGIVVEHYTGLISLIGKIFG